MPLYIYHYGQTQGLHLQLLIPILRDRHLGDRKIGGDERDRTAGLRRARAALSQLSYIPISLISR